MSEARDSLSPGTRVDSYRIVERIGKGGFSLIYLAEDDETGDEVVLKELMPKRLARRADDGRLLPLTPGSREGLHRSRRLFFQEAAAMAALRHPHIVAVLDLFIANETGYIVMQHERGRNLAQLLHERGGGISSTLTLQIFMPLLDALALMHSRSMLHLDVKPGNIHLRNGHDPLLLDLGAVHLMTTGGSLGSQVITSGYSPTEQYRLTGDIGPWTDVYAVGASMRCCFDGAVPPPAPERVAADGLVPATRALAGRYPDWLLEIVDWSMQMDPAKRPRDAGELLRALHAHTEDSRETPATESSQAQRETSHPRAGI